jgi:hypothetical protein
MVFQRATGGNTTYFLGDVTNKGWHHYFPTVYAIKTPLALQVLTILALLFLVWPARHRKSARTSKLKKYFPEIAMLIFLAIYWGFSIASNLNIGVRHVLPAFPFIYLLLAGQFHRFFSFIHKKKKLVTGCQLLVAFLFIWYALSSLSAFPYYLTHFNELVGGNKNGYKYVTDSNLDWGQDLKRLAKWVDENDIGKIKIDYFGGATIKYYLGDKYEPWHGNADPKDAKGSWLAVSATFLQQGRATATKGWPHSTTYYSWLNDYEPVTVIGNSIFIFYID